MALARNESSGPWDRRGVAWLRAVAFRVAFFLPRAVFFRAVFFLPRVVFLRATFFFPRVVFLRATFFFPRVVFFRAAFFFPRVAFFRVVFLLLRVGFFFVLVLAVFRADERVRAFFIAPPPSQHRPAHGPREATAPRENVRPC